MDTEIVKPNDIKREKHLIDASQFYLGRLATRASKILSGKNKVSYTPGVDMGDYLTIINASMVKLSGRKREEKTYYHPTGYIGNLKKNQLSDLMKSNPEKVIKKAIVGMLPNNKHRKNIVKRLRIYPSQAKDKIKDKSKFNIVKNK